MFIRTIIPAIHAPTHTCEVVAVYRNRISSVKNELPRIAPIAIVGLAVFCDGELPVRNHHDPTLSSTHQENNMQKNTTSLWAGSAVAGLIQ